MNTKRIAISLILGTLFLLGCDATPKLDVRTFKLENRSGYEAAELIQPYVYSDREGAPGSMSTLPDAISVRETPDNLDRIERVLADFDKPIQSIRLRFQLIEADSFEGDDPAIADVVHELRGLFRFTGYRLLGEALVSVAGSTYDTQSSTQRFLGTDERFLIQSEVRVDRPGVVRVESLRLFYGTNDVILETSVNVASGQTVVIGGSQSAADNRAFILTVRAEAG